MHSELEAKVPYMKLIGRLRGLLRIGHTIGEKLVLGQSFHDFVALGGGASGTALTRLDEEWKLAATNHYGSAKAIEESLRDAAVALDEIVEALLGLTIEVREKLETVAPEWRGSGKAEELLFAGVFCEGIYRFKRFSEETQQISPWICHIGDKMPALESSINYFGYRFWNLLDAYLIDMAANRGKKLPVELVGYSPNRRKMIMATIPAALVGANEIIWRNCPPVPLTSPLSALSEFLVALE